MKAAILAALLSGCAAETPRPPTLLDGALLSTAFGLYAIDAAQSIQAQGDDHKFTEGNRLLGARPGAARIVSFDVTYSALVVTAWALLPRRWRWLAPSWLAANEGYQVIKSAREGLTPWSAP